jgi:hypothetical protein
LFLGEYRAMLQNFTGHIVKESCGVPEDVPLLLLSHLIPIAAELRASSLAPAAGFPDLLTVMIGLGEHFTAVHFFWTNITGTLPIEQRLKFTHRYRG